MIHKLNLVGQRFGRLTVISEVKSDNYQTAWLCRCDCGNEKVIKTRHLRSGATKSCGCLRDEMNRDRPDQYYPKDVRNRRLLGIWKGMLRRCENETAEYFYLYGGRGITVCNEWHDYVQFARWALNNGYQDNLSIDRIDFNGNYKPGNCRWATVKEQANNSRKCIFITIEGITKTATEWAEQYGIKPATLYARLKRGMDVQTALTREVVDFKKGFPVRCIETGEVFQSSAEAARKYGVKDCTINGAVNMGKSACGLHWEKLTVVRSYEHVHPRNQ